MAVNTFESLRGQVLGVLEPLPVYRNQDVNENFAAVPIFKNKLVKIGRNSRECDIIFPHPSISSIHCMFWAIRFDDDSVPMHYVKDCSLNGISINGLLLKRGQTCLLEDEDVIAIPNACEYRFQAKIKMLTSDLIEQLGFQVNVENWRLTSKVVGSGTFGHVLVANEKAEPTRHQPRSYAVKIIKMKPNRLDKEAKILLRLDHPNVIKVHMTFSDDRNHLYIFQDLITGGDLFSYLAKTDCLSPIPETEALVIIFQILHALKYLHSQGVVHRDLKLDNILLCTPEPCTRIVLADFGIAKDLSTKHSRMHTVVGTPEYCAPEVGFKADRAAYKEFSRAATMEQHGYDAKCDLWSLGVIAHIMLTGISPFYGDGSEASIICNAKIGNLDMSTKQWTKVSEHAKSFVRSLLETNVTKRLDSSRSFQHPWIAKHKGHLEKIYQKKIIPDSEPRQSFEETNWKRKLPKSVKLSPTSVMNKKARKLELS
ncbi:serine/threonine protein kinase MEK1 [Lachancea thermotolerans CBS 6340]|uniref:KLTH0D01386p n=1 Tax=Lachancea thermotolerans (strain ATCC 56472 / CBS 6340 / NRRL Y-8284) TaxID=559295 RepID=C5DG04_LACTC|nr:KLTH0D01386p [Lachancea thermotolerans CBS 6340]CAR22346.1 KLTH0D01386p [Lachancea thermotolerans CBS 6340]